MTETGSVDLVLQLPADLADPLEEVKRQDPEYLSRILRHALARRAVFQELRRELRRGLATLPDPSSSTGSTANA
jgi:hypothetical protein